VFFTPQFQRPETEDLPLLSRWAKDVSPTNAHPEYPRPQMVRREWLNLNGLWISASRIGTEQTMGYTEDPFLVPFPVESKLVGY